MHNISIYTVEPPKTSLQVNFRKFVRCRDHCPELGSVRLSVHLPVQLAKRALARVECERRPWHKLLKVSPKFSFFFSLCLSTLHKKHTTTDFRHHTTTDFKIQLSTPFALPQLLLLLELNQDGYIHRFSDSCSNCGCCVGYIQSRITCTCGFNWGCGFL